MRTSIVVLGVCAAVLGAGRILSLANERAASARLPAVAARLEADVPAYFAAPPLGGVRGVFAPWRVGVQAGHWKIGEVPDEQSRLRGDTGAQWGSLTELQVNLPIAQDVVAQLRAAGVDAELLPATVPPAYEADAFVSIHADNGGGFSSGFKVAAPWRASQASRLLRDAVASSYALATDLLTDRYGVSYNMRGYYAFGWNRYFHAVAVSTPSMIIETGFLTSAADRRIIVDDPERAARGISAGVIAFLAERPSLPPSALVPVALPPTMVGTDNAPLRYFPAETERIAAVLPAGTWVRPVDEENGWVELIVWGNFREFGWMRKADLQEVQGG
jgi:hypothetical protein